MSYRKGGYVEEVEKPYRTLWPNTTKLRAVHISITSWVGTSAIGAKHYYVCVEEEDNYIFCDGTWTVFWDHPEELRGLKFGEREAFTEEADARSWARRIYKKHFDDGLHEPYFVEGEPDWWF